MMLGHSNRRFRLGEKVRCLHDPSIGVGKIIFLGTETTIIYLGRNEWITEYIPFATVLFDSETRQVPIKKLIKDKDIRLYESLRVGDLITLGKTKQTHALVLAVVKRKNVNNRHVTESRVFVLEGGLKKSLSISKNIFIAQRLT